MSSSEDSDSSTAAGAASVAAADAADGPVLLDVVSPSSISQPYPLESSSEPFQNPLGVDSEDKSYSFPFVSLSKFSVTVVWEEVKLKINKAENIFQNKEKIDLTMF